MSVFKKENIFLFFGWLMTAVSIFMLFFQGVTRSFFHQDDVVELAVVARWQGWKTLVHLNNEHLNITFWPLLRLQWLLFGVDYTPYLTLNMVLHVLVLGLIFFITYRLTKSFLWASLPVWGMVVNANWFTVVWWITGQMIFLTTIFSLLTYLVILKIKDRPSVGYLYPLLFLLSILPGLSWGVGLTWPIWPLLIFGIDYQRKSINKIGYCLFAGQIVIVMLYFSLIGDNIGVHTDPRKWLSDPLAIINFAFVGVRNTLVGRWLWPSENLTIRAIAEVVLFLVLLSTKPLRQLKNKNLLFGLVVVVGSFITYAVPRWQFGINHAMANYYAYFPLPFLLISMSVYLSKLQLSTVKRLMILFVFLIHIPMSWLGFEEWASEWVVRPQQTRAYFRELEMTTPNDCLENRYIPEYIVPQNIWKIDYLWPIFKKDFDPFCDIDK